MDTETVYDRADIATVNGKLSSHEASSERPGGSSLNLASPRWRGIAGLLEPHSKLLAFGLVAVLGEGVANLLEPWPLKLAFDTFGNKGLGHGWLNRWVTSAVGSDNATILAVAAF